MSWIEIQLVSSIEIQLVSWIETHIYVSLPADPYMCRLTADSYVCQKINPDIPKKQVQKKTKNSLKWSEIGTFGLKLGGNEAEINHKHF